MKIKSLYVVLMVVLFLAAPVFSNAQSINAARTTDNKYHKGGLYLTPQVALYSYALNFGASMEFGLTENIGIGGTLMLAFWGNTGINFTLITPSVEGFYHFTQLDVDKLDLFAGAALGFSIYSFNADSSWIDGGTGTGSLFLSPVLGGRYYFSEKIAACLKLYLSILGDWAGVGGVLGVTILLK
jgi:hypothetical protein